MDKEHSGFIRDEPPTAADIACVKTEAVEAFKGVEHWPAAKLAKWGMPTTRAGLLEALDLTEEDVA